MVTNRSQSVRTRRLNASNSARRTESAAGSVVERQPQAVAADVGSGQESTGDPDELDGVGDLGVRLGDLGPIEDRVLSFTEGEGLFQRGEEQCSFWTVGLNRFDRHLGRRGNVGQSGRRVAAGGEAATGRFEDPLAGLDGLGGTQGRGVVAARLSARSLTSAVPLLYSRSEYGNTLVEGRRMA